ncbi:NADH-quinone oxidoreductase subunit N [Desulfuromonas versatilis]|uniref:NADH-quinone oxidoreductase subunit N n=1 Tax=Desulfuromonas versatilis TaxID=2802975 RepID=A0ABN6DT97_9BACT|nr:NADH-quinone oxidoreductase subunit N [Desulfuromonas versatilis]BCR03377.1 NADH-quinone oxidoreductase subunit N [Desulfuromonas versatilis]
MSFPELLALLPVLILALGATAILMVGAWFPARRPLLYSGVAVALVAALAAGALRPPVAEVAHMFGAGPYARFFTILWSLLAAMTLMISNRYAEDRRFPGGEYTCLVLFAAAGMALLSSATSLVGVLLGLESFTLVLYILIAIDKQSTLGAEAGLKYLVMGIVATGFLGFGIALVYAATGSLHLPEALLQLGDAQAGMRPLGLLGWAMLLVAIGFKVSLVPFHLWTPDVYQGAPAPVTAILSTGSKGAVFAALITLMLGLPAGEDALVPILWLLAAASMLIGSLCALRQDNIKRMLAYSSVAHMGYLLTGLLAGGEAGRSAVVFYLVVYGAANLGAFGILTSFALQGEEPQNYRDLRGLGYHHPIRGAALALFLLSLAGIPPAAGFLAKFGIFHAALRSGFLGLTLLGVLASLVSLYYYLRPTIVMFMAKERSACLHQGHASEHAVLAVCLAATLLLGLYPAPLFDLIRTLVP